MPRESIAVRTFVALMLLGIVQPTDPPRAHPSVFPTGVTIHEEGVTPGYLVFRGQDGDYYMVDVDGAIVHSWNFPCQAGGAFKLLDNGHVLGKSCEILTEVDWDGNVVWEARPEEGVTYHHDWTRLDDGNTLTLARRRVVDESFSNEPFWEDFILEFSPNGEIVWEWHMLDHWEELNLPEERIERIRAVGTDWSHSNTLARIPDSSPHTDPRFRPGNLILSLRHQNTIAVVDYVSGEIVWSMTDRTIGQHTTHMIPGDYPGGGNILVFDNGWAGDWSLVTNQWRSRVVEIDPLSDQFPWVYVDEDSGRARGSLFSFAISGAQRLPNGNTMITDGRWGRAFEITPDKQIVWEFINPFFNQAGSNNFYRTIKVPYDWAGPQFVSDLALSGAAASSDEAGGVRFDLVVENGGVEPAVGLELVVETSAVVLLESLELPPGWQCTIDAAGGQAIRCAVDRLQAGATAVLAMDVRFCRLDDSPVITLATVSSSGEDADPADNEWVSETDVVGDGCPRDPFCGDFVVTVPGETCDPPGQPGGAAGQTCRDDCTVCGDGEVNGDHESMQLLVDGDLEQWSDGALTAWRLTTLGGTATRVTTEAASGDSALRLERTVTDRLLRAFQDLRGLVPGGTYELRLMARAEGGTNNTTPLVKVVNITRQEWLDGAGNWSSNISNALAGAQQSPDSWEPFRVTFVTPASHAADDVYRVVLQHRGAAPVLYDAVSLEGRYPEQCDDGNDLDDDACSNACLLNPE